MLATFTPPLAGDSEVLLHEMPGGQLTNLLYQSKMLGLSGQWGAVKRSYAAANRILGDIIKVTPSSKVN
jgi:pyruvate carboxylase